MWVRWYCRRPNRFVEFLFLYLKLRQDVRFRRTGEDGEFLEETFLYTGKGDGVPWRMDRKMSCIHFFRSFRVTEPSVVHHMSWTVSGLDGERLKFYFSTTNLLVLVYPEEEQEWGVKAEVTRF